MPGGFALCFPLSALHQRLLRAKKLFAFQGAYIPSLPRICTSLKLCSGVESRKVFGLCLRRMARPYLKNTYLHLTLRAPAAEGFQRRPNDRTVP